MITSEVPMRIEEGVAKQILPSLLSEEAKVLVFISQETGTDISRRKFSALRRLAARIDTLERERDEKKWNALVEALTPDVDLSQNRVIEAEMLAEARRVILETRDFVKASGIMKAADYSSKNPSSQPNRWKRSGQIFAISYKGVDLYPSYALDHSDGVRPMPAMAAILKHLADKDDWQKAFWFESPNSYLQNRKPKSLLRSQPDEVLRAAEIEAAGVQHG